MSRRKVCLVVILPALGPEGLEELFEQLKELEQQGQYAQEQPESHGN